MAREKLPSRICSSQIGCDGVETVRKSGVCQLCQDRMARLRAAEREYQRIQRDIARWKNNGAAKRGEEARC